MSITATTTATIAITMELVGVELPLDFPEVAAPGRFSFVDDDDAGFEDVEGLAVDTAVGGILGVVIALVVTLIFVVISGFLVFVVTCFSVEVTCPAVVVSGPVDVVSSPVVVVGETGVITSIGKKKKKHNAKGL